MILSKITNSHTNIAATLNGAIAGLVAITAEPLHLQWDKQLLLEQ